MQVFGLEAKMEQCFTEKDGLQGKTGHTCVQVGSVNRLGLSKLGSKI